MCQDQKIIQDYANIIQKTEDYTIAGVNQLFEGLERD